MPKKYSKQVAIDTETFYSPNYSIAGHSTRWYVTQPDFDCYMITVANDDMEYVGPPEDFDWDSIRGMTAVAHNASFDERVINRLVELGKIPHADFAEWQCSADMCVSQQYPRSLAMAVKSVFGHDLPKEMRNWMKGKSWDDAVAQGKDAELTQYAMDDAKWTWKLWKKLSSKWGKEERALSQLTRAMAWDGLPVDTDMVDAGVDELEKQMFETKNRLPWYDEIDPDTKKPYVIYSKKALAIECRKRDLPPPKSLAKDSEDLAKWMKEHGSKMSFVADMQNYARMNTHCKRLKSMRERVYETDRISYNLKYWGADTTGRWSGDAGLNIQNLPSQPKYGVNIRHCIRARKGHKLVVADLSQIEPRCIAFSVGDKDFLKLLASGMSPYEAHARQTMSWTGGELKHEDPELYMLAKVRVLQLGYGSGWYKFYQTVKSYGQLPILEGVFDKKQELKFLEFAKNYQPLLAKEYETISLEDKVHWGNAYVQVMDFREKNPLITSQWKQHDYAFKSSSGEDYEVELASGRWLKFFDIRPELDGYTCKTQKGSKRRSYFYGANIFQNTIQAMARDCFAWHVLQLDKKGWKPCMHVHDELMLEVPENEVERAESDVLEVMTSNPPWLKGVPLEAEVTTTDHYEK